jgi:D-serine deaminase-like pyridoxal phosphate-dependent protein
VQVAAAVAEQGGAVIGVHAYDGHLADAAPADRRAEVAAALADLHAVAGELEAAGHRIEELAVAGSHTFMDVPAGRGGGAARVTVGVGTAVYNDSRSLQRYEREPVPPRFVPAGGVLTRVVSRRTGQVTVDAGLTAVQVDAGRPHAEVLGRPDVVAAGVSQEHLVLTGDVVDLQVGDLLVLLPRHLDTAIAQFEVVHRVGGDGSVTRDRVVGRDYSSS